MWRKLKFQLAIALLIFTNNLISIARAVRVSSHPIVLVVSFDGFRNDYLGKVDTPYLDSLIRNGVTVAHMECAFPSVTFSNHQSLATGLFAASHGVVDNQFYDPLLNKTLSGFDDDEGFWNYRDDVLPIWIQNELAGEGRISGTYMWPGSNHGYGEDSDLFATHYIPVYNTSVPWGERVDTVISWLTDEENPANMVWLYFNEPDSIGHAFGPDSPEVLSQVADADIRVGILMHRLNEAGIFDQVNLIIVGDHGMAPVSEERIVNLSSFIDTSLVDVKVGISPFIQLQAKEGKADELFEKLYDISFREETFGVWKHGDLGAPYYYYFGSRRILDVAVLAFPMYAFDDFHDTIRSHNERWNLTADPKREYGVHGYSNMYDAMNTIFIAHGPAFKQGLNHSYIKNVDVVPLISEILGIPEPPNNGTLSNVIDMLKSYEPGSSTSSDSVSDSTAPGSDPTTTPGHASIVKINWSLMVLTSLIMVYKNFSGIVSR